MKDFQQVIQACLRARHAIRDYNGDIDVMAVVVSEEEAVGMQISINSLFAPGTPEVRLTVMEIRRRYGVDSLPTYREFSLRDRLPTPKRGTVWLTIFGIKVVVV